MTVRLTPYLNFRGNAPDALEFYQSVFGGTLNLSTYGELSEFDDVAEASKIMHGIVSGDHGLVLMGADVPGSMEIAPNSSVALTGDDEAVLRGWWDGLIDGATVAEPLTKAPWGDTFGLLTDKFGVPWMVNIDGSSKA